MRHNLKRARLGRILVRRRRGRYAPIIVASAKLRSLEEFFVVDLVYNKVCEFLVARDLENVVARNVCLPSEAQFRQIVVGDGKVVWRIKGALLERYLIRYKFSNLGLVGDVAVGVKLGHAPVPGSLLHFGFRRLYDKEV